MRKRATTSATRLQYQNIGPSPRFSWVKVRGRKISRVSVILAAVPKSQISTATEMTAGNTIARPAQKLACQRSHRVFVTSRQYRTDSTSTQEIEAEFKPK